MLPPPGWYVDPAGSPEERYWDGTGWTRNLREPLTPLDAAGAADSQPAQRQTAPQPQYYPQGTPGPTPGPGGRPQAYQAPWPTGQPPLVAHKFVRATADGVPLAAFGWRALATIIDWVLMTVVGALVGFPWFRRVAAAFEQMMTWSMQNPGQQVDVTAYDYTTPAMIIAFITMGVAFVVQVVMVRLFGGTVGQLLLGLRVVPSEQGLVPRVSWATSLQRSAVWLAIMAISQVVLFPALLSYLRPLWHPRMKTWHDSLAGTQVITTRGPLARAALQRS
ncbi:RDD family protein [Propionibacteriaceae bacterium G1746]|uniref:RDD family protein n=1 Tax=Aestuariimicrobium sp. G57 TaxID=3418485 RepID=UPI003C21A997